MASRDYFVGFEREPRDLDEFLELHGCDLVSTPSSRDNRDYESRRHQIDLFYSVDTNITPGEIPDWRISKTPVVSDLTISARDNRSIDEAERIAKAVVNEYDALFFDPDLKEIFRKGQL